MSKVRWLPLESNPDVSIMYLNYDKFINIVVISKRVISLYIIYPLYKRNTVPTTI